MDVLTTVVEDPIKMAAWEIISSSRRLDMDSIGKVIAGEVVAWNTARSTENQKIELASCTVNFYDINLQCVGVVTLHTMLVNGQGEWQLLHGVVCKDGNIDHPILLQP